MSDETENSIIRGVVTPGLQAFLSGLTVTCFVGSFAWLVTSGNPGAVVLTCGTLSMSSVWFWLLNGWVLERRFQLGMSEVSQAEPVAAIENIRVEISQQNTLQFIDLPVQPEQLVELASGVLSGASMSELTWCGSGRPFSISQFRFLRAELLKRGLVEWRSEHSPSQGVELTRVGRHVMRRFMFLAEQNTPTLTSGDRWNS